MKFLPLFLALWIGLVLANPAMAGPNEGGVIILHRNEVLVYTDDGLYCGESSLPVCDQAVTRGDTQDVVLLHVLAAFPGDGFPRLAGVAFGLDYDETKILVVDWDQCGDFELHTGSWPDSNEGTAVTWSAAQTDYLTEFYWFAAYAYYTDPVQFSVTDHPTGGGNFADDDVPSNIDAIDDYGSFGFHMDGYLPCPLPPTTATLELTPSEITVYQPCGGTFGVDLMVDGVYSLTAFEACLGYDPTYLEFDEVVIDTEFLGSTGRGVHPLEPVECDPTCQPSGIRFGAITTGSETPASGGGRLATIRFSPQGAGSGEDFLCLEDLEFTNDHTPPRLIEFAGVAGLTIHHNPFCFGDFTGDGDVTVFDLAQIIPKWRCCDGDGCYSPAFDVNPLARHEFCASAPDGCIDVLDIQAVAGRWHLGCPDGAPRSESTLAGTDPTIRISPAESIVSSFVGDTTSVALVVDDVIDAGALEASLSFDPDVVHVESVEFGDFLSSTGRTVYDFAAQIDNVEGTVHFGACSVGETAGPDGTGVLARIVFQVESCDATTDLALSDVTLTATDGWPLDLEDVTGGTLEIGCASDVPPGSGLTDFVLFPARPNPFSSSTEFAFTLPSSAGESASVQFDIFSATGRHLRRVLDSELGAGQHRVSWDARDGSGKTLPSGIYFGRLTFEGRILNSPIQLVK